MWQMVLLGAVQGLAEFLPISSSGHLVLVSHLIGIQTGQLETTIWLHFGTLGATCVVYRRDLWRLLRGNWKLAWTLGIALVPAGVVGLAWHDFFEQVFSNLTLVGFFFWLTAVALFLGERMFRTWPTGRREVRTIDALWIGAAQAVALLPGTSRSGLTISAGLACGIRREAAARFSFLLSIPTVAGSVFVEFISGYGQADGSGGAEGFSVLAGVFTSFVVGWIALEGLIALLRRYPMYVFAIYCLLLGAAVLASRWLGVLLPSIAGSA